MSRSIITLSPEQLTSLDLDAFAAHADALNQHHQTIFKTPFPKAPSRWLSHYQFIPRSIVPTSEGEVEGGLSWLVGATIDFSFTRSICAPHYGPRGGHCYDPASLVFLEVAAKVDQYVDYARFCDDLRHPDKKTLSLGGLSISRLVSSDARMEPILEALESVDRGDRLDAD